MPSPGKITALNLPGGPGIRLDTHAYQGYVVPPYYDSMIGKLIAYGETREEAISILRRALDEFVVEGIKTTIPFFKKLVNDPQFIASDFDTSFLQQFKL